MRVSNFNCQTKPALRQRLFASFMRSDDQLSYQMYQEKKRELFSEVRGEVLELGPGTGVNFAFLDPSCRWKGIEPNPAMHPYLFNSAKSTGFRNTALVDLKGDQFAVPTHSQDYVISTLVLCSVPNVASCLQEVRRVLKPGGQFLFIEHVVDKANTMRRWVQKSVPYTPWRYFSDGCDPGRDIAGNIHTAGFKRVEMTCYQQRGHGIIANINRPHIFGSASK